MKAYDFKVEYRPGKSTANADALLHMPIISVVSVPKFELANMPEVQSKDPDVAQLVNYLQAGKQGRIQPKI